MSLRAYRTFQGLVLAALGLFLLSKLWDGSVLLYINQRLSGWLCLPHRIGDPFAGDVSKIACLRENRERNHEHTGHDHSHDIMIMKLFLDGTYGGWRCLSCWGCWSRPDL
jgi:hypothetical protein